QTRKIKEPVYWNVLEMFRRMQSLPIETLLAGSMNPPPDVQIFWSTNADMGWPRANQENAMLWGALKRLGYQPGILADTAFENGAYSNAPVLLLSRCYQMNPQHLDMIAGDVIRAGIHIHADADLPGQFDAYHHPNPNWTARMNSIFGLDVTRANPALDAIVRSDFYGSLSFQGLQSLGPTLTSTYAAAVQTWKIWEGINATSGSTIVIDSGYLAARPGTPALVIKTNAASRSAINTFALGDTYLSGSEMSHAALWDFRSAWLRAIYRTYFKVTPAIDLAGPGAQYVIPDYRICANGSVLISLLNEHTNTANVTVTSPALLGEMKVENLTQGGVLDARSDGVLSLNLQGDDYVLLYAYRSANGRDESLVNPSPDKVWLGSAPGAVWPRGSAYQVTVGYDIPGASSEIFVGFERVKPGNARNKVYGQSPSGVAASGRGSQIVSVPIPDADLNDPDYVSTPDGGEYVFHAWLERDGTPVSDTYLPVRLLWGVRPVTGLPAAIVPGAAYRVTMEWQELPSYLNDDATPLDRAALWDSLEATRQHYEVILELKSNGKTVAIDNYLTRQGTGNHQFSLAIPRSATGPFAWEAYLRTATNVLSHNVEESFEGRERGAVWPPPAVPSPDPAFITPWVSFTYAFPNLDQVNLWQNQGVQLAGSDGSQSAFLVITNPPNQIVSSFGLSYVFPDGDWALPADPRQWTNFVFGYDFKENHSYDCLLEMQIKNLDPDGIGKWLQFSTNYTAGSDGWDTVMATLDQFTPPPGLSGVFEPDKVHEIVLSIRMVASSAQFVASFDNIHFTGPEFNQGSGAQRAIFSSENDVFSVMNIWQQGTGLMISWTGKGILQTATQLDGRWVDLPAATNPQLLTPSGEQRFYRLRQ
ncbi:MAG: hypothetical protein ABI651_18755, partial [Verrucomicrobiota bacterium]